MADSGSEFGYDLTAEDEAQLSQLIDAIPARGSSSTYHHGSLIDTTTLDIGSAHDDALPSSTQTRASAVVAGRDAALSSFIEATTPRSMPSLYPPADIRYPDLSHALLNVPEPAGLEDSVAEPSVARPREEDDSRAPLERFRTFPRKPFSVTDLTAGAWCELQYYYTLTRLPGGKRTRTKAMKSGTKVHKKLEDEVHKTVEIRVTRKEDAFGLKVWNIIQGLRTLRDTGLTRELEVWGMVDGNLVNGYIDGLSYENPDPEWEAELLSSQGNSQNTDSQGSANSQKRAAAAAAAERDQKKITTFFSSDPTQTEELPPEKRIWLTDVKTRGSRKLPSKTAIRPSKIQLFLYHRFLSDMAAGRLDYFHVFRRYGLSPDQPFGDEFVAQIGMLHDEIFYDAEAEPTLPELAKFQPKSPITDPAVLSHESCAGDLIRYNSLRELVRLLQAELAATFPQGADSIGPLVKVEYRSRGHGSDGLGADGTAGDDEDATAGTVFGQNIFWVNDDTLELYLRSDLEWWKGEREPRGVEIEEAQKCRSCEFAEGCSWRKGLDEELLSRTREKLAAARTNSVG